MSSGSIVREEKKHQNKTKNKKEETKKRAEIK